MGISMIGIDHNAAGLDVRAVFSFTKKETGEAMEKLKQEKGVQGCVILSTCNRLELWVSTKDGAELSLYDCLCRLKGIRDDSYRGFFIRREGQEASRHLFRLASGLKSQILGEDQIITQVKDALNLAREHFATDSVLEVLFRMAVTAGKKVRTEVTFSHGNPSVIHRAIQLLRDGGYDLQGKTCMVIGNGEMGKVAAQALREEGADVTVTVREYRSGMVQIPEGCRRINYSERIEFLPQCDLVVSATTSPNRTLRMEHFPEERKDRPLVLIDLAVPRDMDPELGELEGITFYDMDSFRNSALSPELEKSLCDAGKIVDEQLEEFDRWLEGRDIIPRIAEIREEAVRDLDLRIAHVLKRIPMEEGDRQQVTDAVEAAAGKVVSKLIFGLRDNLDHEAFLECVAGLERVYDE